MKSDKPNIIFILSDQQRWDTLGCYGQSLNITPHLDRLAQEGVCFRQAYSCQPICGPARSCLMTGRYPSETGCFRNGLGLREDEATVARYLSASEYDVAYVGKWHLGSRKGAPVHDAVPLERRGGFDGYWIGAELPEFVSNSTSGWLYDRDNNKVEFNKYRVDAFTDFAIQYLDQRPMDKPFFLVLSYVEPHQQSYRENRYQGPEVPNLKCMDNLLRGFMRYEGPEPERSQLKNAEVPDDLLDPRGHWDVAAADYLASCKRIDSNVGRMLKHLEGLGILDDTLVIYSSDHASHFHTRMAGVDKSTVHENSTHIPLIINGPGFGQKDDINQMVSIMDIPPTILAAAGIQIPEAMYGHPLQNIIAGNVERNNEVFIQTNTFTRGIRTPEWSYIVSALPERINEDGSCDKYVETALYNLQKDPLEKNNLIYDGSMGQAKNDIKNRLVNAMVSAGETIPEIIIDNSGITGELKI